MTQIARIRDTALPKEPLAAIGPSVRSCSGRRAPRGEALFIVAMCDKLVGEVPS